MKKIWVIKAGGELMASEETRGKILADLAKWHKKVPIIFVHGGGPQIEAELKRNNIPNTYTNGRRVTSDETMVIVERVLSGQVNKSIVAQLGIKRTAAVGLSGRDGGVMIAAPLPALGRAGRPIKVQTKLLVALLKAGFLPVLSSVASDKDGNPLNVNADDFASALACALKAGNLIYLTDISGVQDKEKNRIPVLKTSRMDTLINDGTIHGGMIPKVQSARNAILKGVGEINIVNGYHGIDLSTGTKIIK